ncbi:MAG: hypothetical protein HN348_28250 [Proteobacteria bacterium]|nr:hypothetical protein [Pseudomonadota bacterium]
MIWLVLLACASQCGQPHEPEEPAFSVSVQPRVEVDERVAIASTAMSGAMAQMVAGLSQPAAKDRILALGQGPEWPTMDVGWCGSIAQSASGVTLDFAECPDLDGEIIIESLLLERSLVVWFKSFYDHKVEKGLNGRVCMGVSEGRDGFVIATCNIDGEPTDQPTFKATDGALNTLLVTGFQVTANVDQNSIEITGAARASVHGGQFNMQKFAWAGGQLILGGANSSQLEDPLLIPIPPTCSCVSQGTVAVTADFAMTDTIWTLTDQARNTVDITMFEQKPIVVEGTLLATLGSGDDSSACDDYSLVFSDYSFDLDSILSVEHSIDALQDSLEAAHESGDVDDTTFDHWQTLFFDAEGRGCSTAIDVQDLKEAFIGALDHLRTKYNSACQTRDL